MCAYPGLGHSTKLGARPRSIPTTKHPSAVPMKQFFHSILALGAILTLAACEPAASANAADGDPSGSVEATDEQPPSNETQAMPGGFVVHAPKLLERSETREVWQWEVKGDRGFTVSQLSGMVLGFDVRTVPNGDSSQQATKTTLQLEVGIQSRDFERLAYMRQQYDHGSCVTWARVPWNATLPELFFLNKHDLRLDANEQLLVGIFNGMPIYFARPPVKTGQKDLGLQGSRLRQREDHLERVYSGTVTSLDSYDPDWQGTPHIPAPIKSDAEAVERAQAYIRYLQLEGWGKAPRVSRTGVGHYRIDFAPGENGRNRAVLVDHNTGYVGFPHYPRFVTRARPE
jgi:hypothetical protein